MNWITRAMANGWRSRASPNTPSGSPTPMAPPRAKSRPREWRRTSRTGRQTERAWRLWEDAPRPARARVSILHRARLQAPRRERRPGRSPPFGRRSGRAHMVAGWKAHLLRGSDVGRSPRPRGDSRVGSRHIRRFRASGAGRALEPAHVSRRRVSRGGHFRWEISLHKR